MEYKFVKFTKHYLSPLTALLSEAFTIQNKDKEKLILWKYFDPFFQNKTFTYITLDKENNVVGHYSSMPIAVSKGNIFYKTTLSTDAAVDKNHRGKGLMSKMSEMLYKDVRSKGYEFSFGYPNDVGVMMDRHSKNYGYQLVGKYIRYTKIILISKKSPYYLKAVNSIAEIQTIDTSSNYYTLSKDRDYILWRYFKKPNNNYKIFAILTKNGTLGYVVTTESRNKVSVIDIITKFSDNAHMKNVLRAIENISLKHGSRIILYNVMDNTYWRGIFGLTYFRKIKPVRYYFSIHLHKNTNKEKILNPDNWISMSGDIL